MKFKNIVITLIVVSIILSCNNEDVYLNENVKKHYIPLSENFIDGNSSKYSNILPGDTICIESGSRDYLKIINLKGTKDQYLIFTNTNGQVLINNELSFGIAFENCQYFKLLGNGDSEFDYGFKIGHTGLSASGLGLSNLSSNFEVAYIEIANTGFAGIMSKSDPTVDNTATRGNFTQTNTIFHDNYIHNTKGEGMYIGYSRFFEYNGLLAHEIHGLRIYNNIVLNTGYDGIQVGCATKDCEIYGNTIIGSGNLQEFGQMSGLQIGGGTTGKVYNNFIEDSYGIGIFLQGLGNNQITGNIIKNAGKKYFPEDLSKSIYGIFCTDDETTLSDSKYTIENNTIISPKNDGIRTYSIKTKQFYLNNTIIEPGTIELYENDNTSRTERDAYIFFKNDEVKNRSIIKDNIRIPSVNN